MIPWRCPNTKTVFDPSGNTSCSVFLPRLMAGGDSWRYRRKLASTSEKLEGLYLWLLMTWTHVQMGQTQASSLASCDGPCNMFSLSLFGFQRQTMYSSSTSDDESSSLNAYSRLKPCWSSMILQRTCHFAWETCVLGLLPSVLFHHSAGILKQPSTWQVVQFCLAHPTVF